MNIPYGQHYLDSEDIDEVVRVLKSGVLTQGNEISIFEQEFASYVGSKYAVAMSSGTAGLCLAMRVLGLTSGDAMLTTPISFVATSNSAKYVGADVVFCDIDSQTVSISLSEVEKALEKDVKNIKVVLPVHFAGLPVDMARLSTIVSRYDDINIVEDACHALGAHYPTGERVGSCKYSAMTVFSLHPVKAIAAGEGGVVTTNSEILYRKLIKLRSHGINKLNDSFINQSQAFTDGLLNPWYYEMQELGFNYRLTDFQAALGRSQLKKIDVFLDRRRLIAEKYDQIFSGNSLIKPIQNSTNLSANHLYLVGINFRNIKGGRATLMRKLMSKGIYTQVHYLPIYRHPYYSSTSKYDASNYFFSESYYQCCLSLPIYYSLSTEDQSYVIKTLNECIGECL